jgi:phage terminase Nu1 subunit (DNA packaging protein)
MDSLLISKAALARHLGVAAPRITALIKRGLPVRPDGKIDLAEALEWMRANCEQQAGFPDRGVNRVIGNGEAPASSPAAAASGDDVVLPFAEAKALRETFLARLAKLEYGAKAGALLDAGAVEREWAAVCSSARARMLAVPARCGARIPHLTPAEVAIIAGEIRDALAELGSAENAVA